MARQYSKQECLSSRESEDLIEVIQPNPETGYLAEVSKVRSARGFMVRGRLPDNASHKDFEITVLGRNLHITGMLPGSKLPSESVIEVPAGYKMGSTRAIYLAGSLRIIVPRE